ncbi:MULTISPECIES: sensor histidine kinase [unclassified Modestobacter]|uniref:sensor histidine kinase n=1 Tax=unclassified Modestobacter TaxID=2643866 RepID=UPI0022AB48C6|nr:MULTISPECIES: sensor histidine kinase [unclassified Modestobacter]MCZ2822869.1 sensor histidine kinase [Modestobacter sp. VKM Ac-2981]MCZ2851115.1 sensor histidine kinase [Modestobacter sp. VKM Ac-2982]
MSVLGARPALPVQRAREEVPSSRPAPTHGHTALVFGSDDALLAGAVPWLEAGLAAGDVMVLSCAEETAELLRSAVGAPEDRLLSDPRVAMRGARAPDAVIATRRLLDRAAASPSGVLRVLGTPEFGPVPRAWREGQRYESAVNELLAGSPLDALCVYDQRKLPVDVVASAGHTHPHLLVDGVPVASAGYLPPAQYLAALPLLREPMEGGPPLFAADGARSLGTLRHQLAAVLATCVPDRDQCTDLHLAVSEIAANAFRHGTPPVAARVWVSTDRVVCTISDCGTGFADPLAGFQPAHGDDLSQGGMGLWLARKLWDHVDLLPGPDGLTVRLSSPLR